jgi:RNA polymerase sigma factor (sigma-70 family)
MFVDNNKINKALLEKDYETLINETEPIISMFLHKSGLWYTLASYRDDLLQEGRLGILSVADKWDFNGKAQFPTFAYIVVRNRIFSYLKKLKWLKGETDYEFDDEREGAVDDDMKPLTMYGTLIDEMEKDKDAEVLKAYYIEEMQQSEIARTLKRNTNYISFIINRFKNKMRLRYGTMYGLDRTDEGKRQYDKIIGDKYDLIDTFYIKGKKVDYIWYNEATNTYEMFDKNNKTILSTKISEETTLENLIERFGDKND